MKNPKVGERCRIYNNGECAKPIDGTVTKYSEKSEWVSFNDDAGVHHSAHRTHLIRLKKKEKRVVEFECWWNDCVLFLDTNNYPSVAPSLTNLDTLKQLRGKRTKVRVTLL